MFQEVKEYGLREPELVNLGSDFRVNLYRKAPETDQYGVVRPTNPEQSGSAGLPDNNQIVSDVLAKMNSSAGLTE